MNDPLYGPVDDDTPQGIRGVIELDDTLVAMSCPELVNLVVSYRNLVGVLLDHTTLHEGTDGAVADFLDSDDRAEPALRRILDAQQEERREVNGADTP